ncbi:DUF2478 domain-containing protein [Roseinatronobacter sp. S2]|uniref:DUF2478 domain-containing protein n=1 Tax=Roseinatronobacter sp. S2 TaxID=3035471 RepID=UPI00240FD63E|nr:DUF2478 domain-containing protein [Roseinatronobacter sp. S2]WFE75184.1 DUF2478 domain-containing protein [Roseinatronobacter sp. S2]
MLGYISAQGRGNADRLLAELAHRLTAASWPLAGVVQINRETTQGRPCDMDLQVIGQSHHIRISHSLGPHASGCRLDAHGLETAVGLVAATLDARPALLILNKFGKAEAEGRGFRSVIGQALAQDIPVLTAVRQPNMNMFLAFADGMAEALPVDICALQDWCCEQTGRTVQTVSLERTIP